MTGAKPLTSAIFLILLSLVDGDRHGLGISDEIARRTGGKIVVGPGTLYNALRRMLDGGLIVESSSRPEPSEDDPRRRYYRITPHGVATVRAEAERLALVVGIAQEKELLT